MTYDWAVLENRNLAADDQGHCEILCLDRHEQERKDHLLLGTTIRAFGKSEVTLTLLTLGTMTAIRIQLVLTCIFLFYSTLAFAVYEELGVEENNEFGGRSLIFRKLEDGVKWGKNSYDSAGKLMLSERKYSEEWGNSHGTSSLVSEYLFEIKIKEERIFSLSSTARRQVKKTTTFFEQATGTKTREENQFSRAYLGNNKIFYDLGKKTRMEWYYPQNQEGFQKVITLYTPEGRTARIENYYTEKAARFDGCLKQVIYFKGSKKEKEEWWFTEAYTSANNEAVRKLKVYFSNPNHPKKPQTYYLDAQGQVVKPNKPFER